MYKIKHIDKNFNTKIKNQKLRNKMNKTDPKYENKEICKK